MKWLRKIEFTQIQSTGAAAGSDDQLEEQLRDTLKKLQRLSHQSKPGMNDLLSGITLHLGEEASERKAIYNRLLAIENEMKSASRRFAGYLVAICFGVVAIVAWQSYGEAARQIIATKAPELGWSLEAKQMIASWVERLGWAKPPASRENTPVQATPVIQTAPETVASKAPAVLSFDPQQVQQIEADIAAAVRQAVERHLADVRVTLEQLAASRDQMAREIEKLQAADQETLEKIPAPPLKHPAAPARKPTPTAPPMAWAPNTTAPTASPINSARRCDMSARSGHCVRSAVASPATPPRPSNTAAPNWRGALMTNVIHIRDRQRDAGIKLARPARPRTPDDGPV